MLLYTLLLVTLLCALQAIRAQTLLASALWLAATSALTACTLYALGGQQVAVIELSVGAGLVTVLFVYAISLAGQSDALPPSVPRWLAAALAGSGLILLLGLLWPSAHLAAVDAPELPFASTFWSDRQLDVLLQIAVIFAGSVSVLGLLDSAVVKTVKIVNVPDLTALSAKPNPVGDASHSPDRARVH